MAQSHSHGDGQPRRVIVTRAREQIEPLARRVEELGHDVVRCPLIELEAIGPDEIEVGGYDWAVVTSPFGARELLRRARGRLPPVAAIGPGTAAALRDGGVEPAFVPRVSTQEGLVAELPSPAGGVLFAGAEARAPSPRRGARCGLRGALPNPELAAGGSPGRRSGRPRLGLGCGGGRRTRSRRSRGVDRARDDARRRVPRAPCRPGGGDARPRRPPRGRRSSRRLGSRRGHHVPLGLRASGRLRRNLPRRDEAARAAGRDHRHHPRDPAAARAPGRSRARATPFPTCPKAYTSRWSIPVWGAIAGRSPCARKTAGSRRARQRAAHSGRRAPRRRQRGA